jgi:acetyl-CoA C-acetyltransferase
MTEAVILGAKRTPIGSFNGSLSQVPATQLGATAISAALESAGVQANDVDEVIMGCVLSAGLGQAPARQAALKAGCSPRSAAMTINKVCGSGLKSVMLGAQSIRCDESQVVVAGGMENMSLAPHLLEKSRTGYRMGHSSITDSMIKDGLWDPYNDFHMGNAAEMCVSKYEVSREDQDAFAVESYRKANDAIAAGRFGDEVAPVEIAQRKGDPLRISTDEEPGRGKPEKFGKLRPAFAADGTVTAANASSINDGAAAVVLANADWAKKNGHSPLAKVVASATAGQAPEWFTTAPVAAMRTCLDRAGLKADDIDAWEINEAFSVVTMVAIKELGIAPERVNARGGAVALGHPIGASGARVLVTLLHTLKQENKRYGMASLCIGGGEAVAVIVENPEANE